MAYPDTPTQRYLATLGACAPAREWVADRTLAECWERCTHLDWLQWLVKVVSLAAYDRAMAEAGAAYERDTVVSFAAYERDTAMARTNAVRPRRAPVRPVTTFARSSPAPRCRHDLPRYPDPALPGNARRMRPRP
jgi:hypothetical protein